MRLLAIVVRCLVAVGTAACSNDAARLLGGSPRVDQDGLPAAAIVTVSPVGVTVAAGGSAALSATASAADGRRVGGVGFAWRSSNPAVAMVTPGGVVTGLSTGTVMISATGAGRSGTATVTVAGVSPAGVVLLAAGDIASCTGRGDEATAALLDELPGVIATLGDNVYPDGTEAEFARCYAPGWGRHRARTHPAVGNHEYETADAAGYFAYFGAAAGEPRQGYYSYDLGDWHVVVLNSNVGMGAGSPQEQWLRADLAAHPRRCTLAYWHHPRFNSGEEHGNTPATQPLWQALYDAGADVVLNGHEHLYERFAPQTPAGAADPRRGLREFVVGTGGASHHRVGTVQPNSEVRSARTFGVLALTLTATGYDWEFVPVAGASFRDAGHDSCH